MDPLRGLLFMVQETETSLFLATVGWAMIPFGTFPGGFPSFAYSEPSEGKWAVMIAQDLVPFEAHHRDDTDDIQAIPAYVACETAVGSLGGVDHLEGAVFTSSTQVMTIHCLRGID